MKSSEGLNQGILLYGYAVLLGASYILAFWRPFGFNIFPYLSLSDILVAPLNRLSLILAPVILLALAYVEKKFKSSITIPFYGFVVVMLLHLLLGGKSLLKVFNVYSRFKFNFDNELGVVVLSAILVGLAFIMFCRSFFQRDNFYLQLVAVILVQVQLVLSAGYTDGKTVFNGALNIHFLEQKNLCDNLDVRDWVYVEKFGSNVFFMNAIDKRLCILNDVRFNLISRKYRETL